MRTAVLKIVQLHVIGIEKPKKASKKARKKEGGGGEKEMEWPLLQTTNPKERRGGEGKGVAATAAVPTILQSSSGARCWLLWAPSEALLRRSPSLLCSGVLLSWKMEPEDLLGRFLRPVGAELMHTHPPRKSGGGGGGGCYADPSRGGGHGSRDVCVS